MKESDITNTTLVFDHLSAKDQALITTAYRSISCTDKEVFAYFKKLYPSERDIHYAVCNNEQLIWTLNPSFKIKQQKCFRQMIGTFLGVVNAFSDGEPMDYPLIDAYRKLELRLRMFKDGLSYAECIKFMPFTMREIVDDYYKHQMLEGKGARVRHYIERHLPTAEKMAAYINRPIEDFREITPTSIVGKTIQEVREVTLSLKRFIDQIMLLTDEELHDSYINCFYPFLGVRKGKFVRDYQLKHGNRPLLYLLKEKLCASESLYDKAYVLFYGLDGGEQQNRNTIAAQFHVTYSRIQQLIADGPAILLDQLLKDPEWAAYQSLNQLPFLLPDTQEVVDVIEREQLGLDFVRFAHLYALLGAFRVASFGDQIVLLNKDMFPTLDLTLYWNMLERALQKNYKVEKLVSMDNYMGTVSEKERALSYALLSKLLEGVKGVSAADGHQIRFEVNQIELDKVFVEILKQQGKPMDLMEVHAAYSERFPQCPISTWRTKQVLKKTAGISYIRNSRSYGLTSWDYIYFGTIRELLRTLLTQSKKPVHIDTIMKQVVVYFPKATKRSVVTSMQSEPQKRFTETVGKDGVKGYWIWK